MPDTALTITESSARGIVQLKSWVPEVKGAAMMPSLLPPHLKQGAQLLALGFNDWWIVAAALSRQEVLDDVRHHLEGRGMAVTDMSSAFRALRIEGSYSRGLLAKGCGVNLDPWHFPGGHCTRTRFAQLPVALHCLDSGSRFDLYVARSHFTYLHRWLIDAAAEFHGDSTASQDLKEAVRIYSEESQLYRTYKRKRSS